MGTGGRGGGGHGGGDLRLAGDKDTKNEPVEQTDKINGELMLA